MHYSFTLAAAPIHTLRPLHATAVVGHVAGYRAEADRRWPMIVRKLAALSKRGRRSLRVVDADCGTGELLVAVARQARTLGFVAIEARGVDRDPRRIASARIAARSVRDPAIGLTFEVGDAATALREEAEFPADLVLYEAAQANPRELAQAARAAGQTALGAARA